MRDIIRQLSFIVTAPSIGLSRAEPRWDCFPNETWREEVIQLYPGDLVVAYTDGVIETSNPSGKEWGIDGLLQAAEARRMQSADEIVRTILDSMDAFSGGVQTDDATVTVLRVI